MTEPTYDPGWRPKPPRRRYTPTQRVQLGIALSLFLFWLAALVLLFDWLGR